MSVDISAEAIAAADYQSPHLSSPEYRGEEQRYRDAIAARQQILTDKPELKDKPGELAAEISNCANVEHSIAVIVALSPAA
ncbi:hypothetical protein [Mycobacterium sp. 360MFTsu5.1]|uniref:hypothetical protein n=1 Tax=Mycobacterium sp. 360MFTsu5.1 TaxID=1172186 RepID=UPI0012DF3074|nr:hypothetical protein [Mycobacterium sp. 360MFTsu5.1]